MTTSPPGPEPAAAAPVARRRSVLALTLCAPVAAALPAAAAPAAAAPAAAPPVAPDGRGYRRSAHIDTYYASLRY